MEKSTGNARVISHFAFTRVFDKIWSGQQVNSANYMEYLRHRVITVIINLLTLTMVNIQGGLIQKNAMKEWALGVENSIWYGVVLGIWM